MESKTRCTLEEARRMYAGCKFLLINIDASDIENISGEVAYISRSSETLPEMAALQREYNKKCETMIAGSYYDGGDVGVLYQVGN